MRGIETAGAVATKPPTDPAKPSLSAGIRIIWHPASRYRWKMDVSDLIEALDDLVREAKTLPLTKQARLARQELFGLLDQMRESLPAEMKQARLVVTERQQTAQDATRETDQLLADARRRAAEETSQATVAKLAEREAQQILTDARRQALRVRTVADERADEILSSLDVNLEQFLQAVQRGRESLRDRFGPETAARSSAP